MDPTGDGRGRRRCAQLQNIAALPWTFKHVAVMPDVHYGKGATVGSVIAMRDAVSPAAVGVDIGCGMTAVRTSLTATDLPDDLGRLRSNLERAVPVGFGQHRATAFTDRDAGDWDRFWRGFDDLTPVVKANSGKALHQMGTLGGGNHFIEICLDTTEAGLGDAALRVAAGSGTSSRSTTSRWRAGWRTTSRCRTRTWRCSSRTPRR